MPTQFFFGWALWEKMTFVLAGAIVLTFALGFAKLWWMSRQDKKNTILDEEKRIKVQEMRMSRRLIKAEEEVDIPFGVRAIESGIEVDGIWVSRSNTPMTASLRSVPNSESSIKSSARSKDSDGSISPGDIANRDDSSNGLPLPTFRQTRSSSESVALGEYVPPAGRVTSSKHRESAYRPRQGSGLRWSSYGDIAIHKDTLSQLEGTAPPKKVGHPHRDRSSYAPVLPDSEEEAVADNERSSGTDSDGTLSNREPNRASHQSSRPSSSRALEHESIKSQTRRSDESVDLSQMPNTGEQFCFVLHSPPRSIKDPHMLLDAAPTLSPAVIRNTNVLPRDETEALGETQWPLLSQRKPSYSEEPVFIPGTLHVNKTVRKVNSGFEVLPAGTFDAPNRPSSLVNATPGSTSVPATDMKREPRQSRRLQKRRRQSATGSKSSML